MQTGKILPQVLNRCSVGYWSIMCSRQHEADSEALLEDYDVVLALPH